MIKIDEIVIVEGKYDKIKLSSVIDATIITTDGFGIFNNKDKQKLIRKLAEDKGIIILTDSDNAGFMIRSFLKGIVPNEKIRHAYIPDLYGKEKRKTEFSAEGKLGVEGMPVEVIEKSLKEAGVVCKHGEKKEHVSKTRLYSDGFIGTKNSALKRKKLQKKLGLPENMSSGLLCEIIDRIVDEKEYEKIVKEIEAECE